MSKLLKIIFSLVGVVALLIIAAVILVPLFVDPNEHKAEIVAEVKKATGRDLTIDGDIGLSVFPWLGLELGGVELSNATGFGNKPFFALKQAQVRVKLLPLLSKQLVVDTVTVQGLRLNLAKNADGVSNWDDLTKGPEEPSKERKAEPGDKPSPAKSGDGLKALTVGGIEISDALLVWDDKASDQHVEVKNITLQSGEVSLDRPIDLELSFSLDSQQPALHGDVTLAGQLVADADKQLYQFDSVLLTLMAKGEGLPEAGVEAEMRADMELDLRADKLDVKGLQLVSGDLKLSGGLVGRALQTSPTLEGSLALAAFSPRQQMQRFGVQIPQTADPSVLNKLDMAFNLRGSSKNLALEKLALNLDQTKISGGFKLLDFSQPIYRFDLTLDGIDVDRYLPPPQEPQPATAQQPAQAPTAESELIPVETLRPLDIEGALHIGKLKAKQIRAEFVDLKVMAKQGKITLDQQVKRFYDGTIKGNLVLDVTGKQPRMVIEERASGIQAGPLVIDVTNQDRLNGTGGFNARLTTSGQTVDQFKRTLGGTFDFSFRDGAVKGFNLARMLREAKAKLEGKKLPLGEEQPQTDFAELSASGRIDRGLLSNQDLLMKSPFIRVTGKGRVDLVGESLSYLVRPVIVATEKGQGGKEMEDLVGVPIPVKLEGPWAKPDWRIDLNKVLLDSQKAKAEKKLQKELDKKLDKVVPDELKQGAPDLLKKLF